MSCLLNYRLSLHGLPQNEEQEKGGYKLPDKMKEEFVGFPKIARISRDIVITEKIDGTNAQVCVTEDGDVLAGSRTRWVRVGDDNFGFAGWVKQHEDELRDGLGVGRHYGEWWGQGIQRGYGLKIKKFSLFNVGRWAESRPDCCDVVPTLYVGGFDMQVIDQCIEKLRSDGSMAVAGFLMPEGVVIYHTASGALFKKTLYQDGLPKGVQG